jgi:hypothetical protein
MPQTIIIIKDRAVFDEVVEELRSAGREFTTQTVDLTNLTNSSAPSAHLVDKNTIPNMVDINQRYNATKANFNTPSMTSKAPATTKVVKSTSRKSGSKSVREVLIEPASIV